VVSLRTILRRPFAYVLEVEREYENQSEIIEQFREDFFTPDRFVEATQRGLKTDLLKIQAFCLSRLFYGHVVGPDVPPPIPRGSTLVVKAPSGVTLDFRYEDLVKRGWPSERHVQELKWGAIFLLSDVLTVFKDYPEIRREYEIDWLSKMFRTQPTCWWSDIPDLSRAPHMTVDDWINLKTRHPDYEKRHFDWVVYCQVVKIADMKGITIPKELMPEWLK